MNKEIEAFLNKIDDLVTSGWKAAGVVVMLPSLFKVVRNMPDEEFYDLKDAVVLRYPDKEAQDILLEIFSLMRM